MTIEEIMMLRENEEQSAIINRLKQGRSQTLHDFAESEKGLNPDHHDIKDPVKRKD